MGCGLWGCGPWVVVVGGFEFESESSQFIFFSSLGFLVLIFRVKSSLELRKSHAVGTKGSRCSWTATPSGCQPTADAFTFS